MDVFVFAETIKTLYEQTDQDNGGTLSAADFLEQVGLELAELED